MRWLTVCIFLLLLSCPSSGDERLKGIACRSVHLGYPVGEGDAFYNEVIVDQSAPGTYFMVCGWNKGYCGLQEKGDGKKVFIFSVWDPGQQNDPKIVENKERVELLYKDEKVRTGRFGGEGTGGQSFLDLDWQSGRTYRFLITSKIVGKRTEYTGSLYFDEAKAWKRLISFSTPTGGIPMKGYYSFVEDFKRDKISTTKARSARFQNGWVHTTTGEWLPLTKARFTADANPVLNIDSHPTPTGFTLITGGETQNVGTQLRSMMDRAVPKDARPPADIDLSK